MFVSADVGSAKRGPGDDFWYYPVGNKSAAGVRISTQTALAITTMYACALVLGQDIGKLPCQLYRRLGEKKGQEQAVDHPLYRIIHRRPNRWQTAFQWRQMMQWHLMLQYNAYSEILYDRRGQVSELIPLHPGRVVVERMRGADGVINFRYRVRDEAGGERVLVRGEMFHVRGLTTDGVEGFSPLDAQRESLSEAYVAQRYSSSFLQNDARPGGVLEWAGHFSSDEEARKFRTSWQEAQAGANRGKTAVLQKGMTWKDIGAKNSDIQLIELRKLKAYDVAAMNRMPPHKVGLMERATFSNIEHQAIEYSTDTMHPWCVNWEQELSSQLLLDKEQEELYFEFNMNALQRGDMKTRSEFYGKRFGTGSLSPNEIRRFENENPVEGEDGDRYFVAVNLVPLDRVDDVVDRGGNRDAGPGSGGDQGGKDESSARAARIEQAAAERVVRKEVSVLRKMAPGADYLQRAEHFYAEHIAFVEDVMQVDGATAMAYCEKCVDFLKGAAALEQNANEMFVEIEVNGPRMLLAMIRGN